MRFGSVCSGIEAASVAWEPLGWQAAWFAEIEPFPSAVLKYHYANVPNLGDMTRLPEMIRAGEVEAPDLFCGGTPCQAFSVAGLRKSLDDARGNLSLTFCEIANAIDHVRSARGEQPAIVFWENVPGVLSTADNAFGCFLSALAGCDTAIDPLAATGWTNAGVVAGPQRTVAWRVLDAQYFGLAQRRRRVFVVASAREGFDPVEVLLEFDGVRRDSAPSREAREAVAGTIEASLGRSRGAGTPTAAVVGSICSNAGPNGHGFGDFLSNQAADAGHIMAFGGNRTSGPIDVAPALNACGTASGRQDFETEAFVTAFHPTQDPISSTEVCHAIGTGSGQGCATAAVAFDSMNQAWSEHVTHTLRVGRAADELPMTLSTMQVRRLTPVECERLQGFPDGYTAIPWRNKPASECPDGPRYKALGNSWAVPCVRWIGRRIHNAVVGRPA